MERNELITLIEEARSKRTAYALCIIVSSAGSTPRASGAKMIVYPDGSISGTIGGGKLEKKVIEDALIAIRENKCNCIRYNLLKDLGMSCGGTIDIYIEPSLKSDRLYIFGAGHIGQALAEYAHDFNFEITLIDDRKQYLDQCKLININKVHLPFKEAAESLTYDGQCYICILTYSHDSDREVLSCCIEKEHAYLGMMGSRRKVELTKKTFLQEGICTREQLESVDMPIGMEIGAEGPKEIAISILARLIQARNSNSQKSLPAPHSEKNELSQNMI